MKKYKKIIILVNLIILLVLFNHSLFKKEELLSNGKLILLELAPVDPRSLMQGDYMTLSYAIARNINNDSLFKRGFCILKLDNNGVGKRVRTQENKLPINDGEYSVRYTLNGRNRIHIGAESFFFQEGKGEKYEEAKYGAIKVNTKGDNVLVGLYDKNRIRIE